MGNGTNTATLQELATRATETRIASYLLADYLEDLGDE